MSPQSPGKCGCGDTATGNQVKYPAPKQIPVFK